MNLTMNMTYGLQPSYHGFVVSTYDALVLFEACFSGYINHVSRRPHDRERGHIIKSGNIFIYEENTSGIKRWTDGVSWSPSRILSNFLIYRQLEKAFPPGQKKKAKKPLATNKSPSGLKNGVTKNGSQAAKSKINVDGLQRMFSTDPSTPYSAADGSDATSNWQNNMSTLDPELERSLVGSLTDSYDFMDEGLVKKTISIIHGDVTHHLVSYYTVADALARGKFQVPSRDPRLLGLTIRHELLRGQTFRSSVNDIDPLERTIYAYYGGYDVPALYFGPLGPHPRPVPFHASPGADSYQSPTLPPQLSQPLLQGPYDNNHLPYTQHHLANPTQHFNGQLANASLYPVPPGMESYSAPAPNDFHANDFPNLGPEVNRALIPMPAMSDAPNPLRPRYQSDDIALDLRFDSRLGDPNFGTVVYYDTAPAQRTLGFGPNPHGLEFNTGFEEEYQAPPYEPPLPIPTFPPFDLEDIKPGSGSWFEGYGQEMTGLAHYPPWAPSS